MKTIFSLPGTAILAIILLLVIGCADNSATLRLEAQRDSLQAIARERDVQISDMTMFFDSVASCLDSIAITEHMLLPVVDPETMRPFTKREIRERLSMLAGQIARQREKIRMLTDSVDSLKRLPTGAGAANTVLFLTRQLEEKEAAVARLMKELDEKNRNIRDLQRNMEALRSELNDVTEQNSALATAVVAQSEQMNEGYVLVGDKKQLQALGVLSKGGLFKKSSFNASAVDPQACRKVDIRHMVELPLPSRKAKMLSAAPEGSYHWVETGAGRTLVVDNPTQFWSLTNILVIQL